MVKNIINLFVIITFFLGGFVLYDTASYRDAVADVPKKMNMRLLHASKKTLRMIWKK